MKKNYTYTELLEAVITFIEDEYGGMATFVESEDCEKWKLPSKSSLYTILARPKEGNEPSTKSFRTLKTLAYQFWGVDLSQEIVVTREAFIYAEQDKTMRDVMKKSRHGRGNGAEVA
jgi:hypothetical protein